MCKGQSTGPLPPAGSVKGAGEHIWDDTQRKKWEVAVDCRPVFTPDTVAHILTGRARW